MNLTGITSSVAKKLLIKSTRQLSEERSFPSTLMERGTSGRMLTAAFRKASAGRRKVENESEKAWEGQEKQKWSQYSKNIRDTSFDQLNLKLKSRMRQLLTLGQTLIGQSNLTGQQVEAESTEDVAERRDGDETVGGTCLKERGRGKFHAMLFL